MAKDKKKKENFFRRLCEEAEFMLFFMGLTIVPLSVVGLYFYSKIPTQAVNCMMKQVFGVYCPGCGGTRSVMYLLHGQFLESFYYHPFVIPAVVLYLIFMIRNGLHYLKPDRFPLMEFRTEYAFAALALVVLECVIKNILAFGFHIYLC